MMTTTYKPETYKYLDLLKDLDISIKDDLCSLLFKYNWFPNWVKNNEESKLPGNMSTKDYNDFMNSFTGAWKDMDGEISTDEIIEVMNECGKRF